MEKTAEEDNSGEGVDNGGDGGGASPRLSLSRPQTSPLNSSWTAVAANKQAPRKKSVPLYFPEDGPFAHYLTTGLSRFATTKDIVQHISEELEGEGIEVEFIKNLRYRPRNVYLVAGNNQPPPKFRTRHDMNVWMVKLVSNKFLEEGAPVEFKILNNSKTVFLNMVANNHISFLLELAEKKNVNETTVIVKQVPRHLTTEHLRYAFKEYDLVDDPHFAISRINVGPSNNAEDDKVGVTIQFNSYHVRFKNAAEARQFVRENINLHLDGFFIPVQGFRE